VKDVGEADVIVTYESDGKTVCGVIIVAKGGDNGTVVTQITEAVEALLGLPAHKIKVLKMS
jgi:stage III sporulation protein AG